MEIKNIKRADIEALTPPAGRAIMVIGPGYWGRGKSGKEALVAAMKASGMRNLTGERLMVFEVAQGAYVSNDASICYPNDGAPSVELMRGKLTNARAAKPKPPAAVNVKKDSGVIE